tara:strand:+ start:28544 stop:28702 length:159 start_codon:yes stop_codon:yes gene_type:complete
MDYQNIINQARLNPALFYKDDWISSRVLLTLKDKYNSTEDMAIFILALKQKR